MSPTTLTLTREKAVPHPDLPAPSPSLPPDATFYAVQDGLAVARAAVWHAGPLWEGRHTGLIGHYAALSDEAAALVLEAAADELHDAELMLGPIDGSTWFKYRLVTDWGDGQPFALEPWNSAQEVERWQAAGFTPHLTYHSSVTTPETSPPEPRAEELAARFAGVNIRPPSDLNADLQALHTLSLSAFAGNPLYSPLPLPAFEGLYRPLLGLVPLDWVWLAERDGVPVGFLFAYPDAAKRGRLILKTLAIASGRQNAGLGRYLSHLLHTRAFAAGFSEVIHALMWDGNESAALSARRGGVIRRYAVFGKSK